MVGQAARERGVAERDGGLGGEGLEQPEVGAGQSAARGQDDRDRPEIASLRAHRDHVVGRTRRTPQLPETGSLPGTSRVAVAPAAETERAAASATAGSRVPGEGASARRLLKSASASYGCARDP